MQMTGAEAIVKCLELEDVSVVFGIPGGTILPLFDKLSHSKKIRFILNRHEQVSAHAADAYARVTGKPGVCFATSGPGATNLVTGIANAYMDSVPMIAITGQVPTTILGTDAFQEADITGITLPVVKHNYLIRDVNDIPYVMKEAFYIASTGRPGPVLIDVPRDIQQAVIEKFSYPEKVDPDGYKPKTKHNVRQVKEAAKLMLSSERPVLYVGGGVISGNATDELKKLAEKYHIPVTTTLMGKGAFPEDHKLSLGMLGMHGTRYANYAVTECDLLIALGARFDDRVTGKLAEFAPHSKIIHADIDPAEIGKNKAIDVPIVGDIKGILKELATVLSSDKKADAEAKKRNKPWLEKILAWKDKHPLKYAESELLLPEHVIEQISNITAGQRTIVTTGVGQHQMWSALYYKTRRPRSFLTSGGLGTMGFGMPAALGAQLADPEAIVIDIDGDGSFQMVSQDLATAAFEQLPIIMAVMNNGYLGMVRQWQELFYSNRFFAVNLAVGTPDFVKLAEAYGATGIRVTKKSEVKPALEAAIRSGTPKKGKTRLGRPVLIDFMVGRKTNVYPMVPPGAPISQMIGGE